MASPLSSALVSSSASRRRVSSVSRSCRTFSASCCLAGREFGQVGPPSRQGRADVPHGFIRLGRLHDRQALDRLGHALRCGLAGLEPVPHVDHERFNPILDRYLVVLPVLV
jgi:hypothetical protein